MIAEERFHSVNIMDIAIDIIVCIRVSCIMRLMLGFVDR